MNALEGIKKDIAESESEEYLKELRAYLNNDLENSRNDINKKINMTLGKLSEEEYQKMKEHNIRYFTELQTLIDKRLKELV